jgi:flagellar hook-length control protein FliK
VPSGETVEAAAERTTASTGLPQGAQAQKSQHALPEGARANAAERSGQALEQATTGTANATTANATAKAMDRAVTPGPVQPAEVSGPTSASPSGAGAVGLMQAAARISAMIPAQARPAAASSVPLDQVAVHIQRAAAAGQDRIRIRLHPAELGQIDVKLKLAGDGVVKAIVTVDRPETFELLQRDARGLEKALQDAGLKTDSGSLSFNLRGQAQYGSDAGRGGAGLESQGPGTDPKAEPQIDPQLMAAANAAGSNRLLDMRV